MGTAVFSKTFCDQQVSECSGYVGHNTERLALSRGSADIGKRAARARRYSRLC